LFDPLVAMGFGLQEKESGPSLHMKNINPHQKNTWSTHVDLTSHKGT